VKIAASKRRLDSNRMKRAYLEVAEPFHAGRTAASRAKLVNNLVNKIPLFENPYVRGRVSYTADVATKRKEVAGKLIAARKVASTNIPYVSKPLYNLLKHSLGWKSKPKGSVLKKLQIKEWEQKQNEFLKKISGQ